MRELFYEESAKIAPEKEKSEIRKFNTYRILSIIFYVFAGIWFLLVYFTLDTRVFTEGNLFLAILFVVMPFILFIGCGILFGLFKKKFFVEYDYTFVSGSFRIAKVIKNYKRKPILMFDASNIERLGKYDSETYQKYESMPGIKKLILTSNKYAQEDKDFYYLVVNVEGEKKLLIIESTKTLLINILQFAKRTILEEGFGK